jgi:putative tricarboxylic transport membrane protein
MGKKTDMTNFQSYKDRINFNTIVSIFLIVFSIVAFFLIPYQIEKPKLFMGRSLMQMEPSLFPRVSIVGLFILSVFYLMNSVKLNEKNLFRELEKQYYLRILVSFVIFVAYALLIEPLGFVLSSALMVGSLSFYYGNRNLIIFFLILIGAPLIIYFLFTRLLRVSLPEGLLF